ncbi:hypothetical protein SAMN05414138_1029 [Rhodoplanes sp. JGI PP 4-B12]|uniref:hypothetical protein n=1 Tax=Rhodoplanes sp. JGI PP 4-B12 TaxID=1873883 RepID=UPI000B4FE27C|nr:hypothetical protein [Rhodoplanes sp. JGI PP 4-B12]SNB53960.1 hypothetical protein SAMN05414138_1029 [Rhodoplanes sp. JGI PP 4-B12]
MTTISQKAILFDEPLDVLIEEARLLDLYREQIGEAIEDILRKSPNSLCSRAAATAFVARIGSNIPDHSIAAAVKSLAIIEFARRGLT